MPATTNRRLAKELPPKDGGRRCLVRVCTLLQPGGRHVTSWPCFFLGSFDYWNKQCTLYSEHADRPPAGG